jgi:hypothetical protein
MSEKVLKLAGKRPMLLALIVMTTLVLGILFSGWLTPMPGMAQQGGGGGSGGGSDTNSSSTNSENTNCVATTNAWSGTCPTIITNSSVTPTTIYACYSNAPTMPTNIIAPVYSPTNIFTQLITYDSTNCTTVTNTENVTYTVGGVFWTNFSSPYTNFPAHVTNSFSADADVYVTSSDTNLCASPGLINLGTVTWKPDAVTSLTPSAGLKVNDGDGDPDTDTYLVQSGCNNTITVTASDSLGLSPADLPDCWEVSPGLATFVDYKHFTIDGNTIGKTVISVNCGSSHKTITIIVYEAVYVINADHGNCELTQHAWWDLTIQPSDAYDFLTRDDGTDLSIYLGLYGYYGEDGSISCGDSGCPAHLEPGPQPITGTDPQEYYAASGSYWWCISFPKLIGALTYVEDLDENPGLYTITSNSCVTQAIDVGNAAGETILFSGYTACGFSSWLNTLRSLSPPVCYCQTGN